MELITIEAITNSSNDMTAMSPDHIRVSGWNDQSYTTLINIINQGFPTKCSLTEPEICDFWLVWHRHSTERDLILMDRRIVVPKSLRGKLLCCLHSAHQGIEGMKACANDSVYWPGMNASIRNFWASCSTCATITPSQPWEPITITPALEWPFQQIVMGIFHIGHIAYLACADRLTGWLILYHLKPGYATKSKFMSICRQLFQTYGTPDELSTDSGPLFTSSIFQEFLQMWCVKHRLSSVGYPQSNGQAELVVKTAKRIVNRNMGLQGSSDNDSVARAILLYWNTPIQGIGLSLVQLLFHCQLLDSILSQPILYKLHSEWVVVAQCCKELLHHCNAKIIEKYNRYTLNFFPLQAGDTVAIQNPLNHQWNTTGKIITVLPDRQYQIRVDGSGRITLRNHHFLRKCEFKTAPTPIPSATLGLITSTINAPLLYSVPLTHSGNDTRTAVEPPPKQTTHTSLRPWSSKISQAVSGLHNRQGLKERHSQ